MGFLSSLFGSKSPAAKVHNVKAAGVVKDEGGWYYEETQSFSKSQNSIRIEQNKPGDWTVVEGFCDVDGLNDSERAQDVQAFFAGSYRWIRFEREPVSPKTINKVKVIGTYRDPRKKTHEVMLGYLMLKNAEEIERKDVSKMWGRISFLRFPNQTSRRPQFAIRFDIMGPESRSHEVSSQYSSED